MVFLNRTLEGKALREEEMRGSLDGCGRFSSRLDMARSEEMWRKRKKTEKRVYREKMGREGRRRCEKKKGWSERLKGEDTRNKVLGLQFLGKEIDKRSIFKKKNFLSVACYGRNEM